jgi:c-di-GMP-binding flagellar brake protein YcgR
MEESKIKKSKITRGAVKEYWNGQERRKSLRINASLVVRYSIEKRYSINSGKMKDVSSGGMRLILNEKLKEEAFILLEFDLPDGKEIIKAEGKVIWSSGEFGERDESGKRLFQTGIQFVNIKAEGKKRLVTYIEKIAEKT